MKWRSKGGFTVVEVMITLAVSSTILLASVGVFNGRRESTEFSQAVYDLQSKLQNVSSDASAAQLPSGQSYTCVTHSVSGKNYAELVGPPQNTNDSTATGNCIYMGKAVQIIQSTPGTPSNSIYIYPVLGQSTFNQLPVTDTTTADPEPALDNSTPQNWLLTEHYQLTNGVTIKYAKLNGTESDLLAMYTSFYNTSNTSGNEVKAFAYYINFVSGDEMTNNKLKPCIEESYYVSSSITCKTEQSLANSSWLLCVQGGKSTQTALLSVRSTATGITVTTQQVAC